MIDGQTSPIDLRIDRTAVEVVFGNMHRFGLMELGVTLAHELCVDESLLQAA